MLRTETTNEPAQSWHPKAGASTVVPRLDGPTRPEALRASCCYPHASMIVGC